MQFSNAKINRIIFKNNAAYCKKWAAFDIYIIERFFCYDILLAEVASFTSASAVARSTLIPDSSH